MSKKLHIFFALFVFITLPIIGLSQSRDSLKTVVAQKGEGIYKILRDNGYPPEKYYNKFLDLNKEKISAV